MACKQSYEYFLHTIADSVASVFSSVSEESCLSLYNISTEFEEHGQGNGLHGEETQPAELSLGLPSDLLAFVANAPTAPGNTASGHALLVVASLSKSSEDTNVVDLESPAKSKSTDICRGETLAMANFVQHKA